MSRWGFSLAVQWAWFTGLSVVLALAGNMAAANLSVGLSAASAGFLLVLTLVEAG